MDGHLIEGVIITPLKQIFHAKGNVFHGMKESDPGFSGFGEAYFSTVNYGDIKPWKRHNRMTLNFIVPLGEIKIVIYDDREKSATKNCFFEIILSATNYQRVTIPLGLWVSFAGIGDEVNILLNIANLEHDPSEVDRLELDVIKYKWV